MLEMLSYLREQSAAYLQDAESAGNDHDAARLAQLAARCQEDIRYLERFLKGMAGPATNQQHSPIVSALETIAGHQAGATLPRETGAR